MWYDNVRSDLYVLDINRWKWQSDAINFSHVKSPLEFSLSETPPCHIWQMKQLDVDVSRPASAINRNQCKGSIASNFFMRYELFSSMNFGPVTDGQTDGQKAMQPTVHKHRCAQKCCMQMIFFHFVTPVKQKQILWLWIRWYGLGLAYNLKTEIKAL